MSPYGGPGNFPIHQSRNFTSHSSVRSRQTRSTAVRRQDSNGFKVIVWATDGSKIADNALPYAKSVALAQGAQLIVVHVDEFAVGRGGGYSVNIDEREVQAAILRQVEGLKREGLDACLYLSRIWKGGAAHVIAKIAKEVNADLIVAGTHGHGPLLGPPTGSLTRKLTRMVACPVLVVPTKSVHTSLL
jgi:nucleotide-binding universal stress UspA family protein